MAPILTHEDVVWRIAAECAYIDERGGVGSPRTGGCDRAAMPEAITQAAVFEGS
jgi:hypothetical protein